MAAKVGNILCRSLFRSTTTKTVDILTKVGAKNIPRCISTVGPKLCTSKPKANKEKVTINFIDADGTKMSTKATVGDNLLDVVIENDIDIDGFGACEGTLACSTCHLIFDQKDYDKLPEEPTDEELDMLDLAYGLTDTSRLGCQVCVSKDMEGLVVTVPGGIADARDPNE
ncbi:unnamed protein product [Owenia fusiformis]|uniref:Uncharacterized protein n=1 Tax=Owenia fusiformis TaxID=6347 RepID=A0A8J1TBM7_OWEFU|nr:unnamed protein product [Owenia fusiformis]